MSGFNPCSRGVSPEVRVHSDPYPDIPVSILVLVDVSPEVLRIDDFAALIPDGFNPCSRGCFARRQDRSMSLPGTPNVSILVLVDVSPEAAHTASSFNPCSRGCSPEDGVPAYLVSILVLVDVSPEGLPSGSDQPSRGFNPCSRGCFARST